MVFWHISSIPPRISWSEICFNTPISYIAAIFTKYCYTAGSWLFANMRCSGCSLLVEMIVKRIDYADSSTNIAFVHSTRVSYHTVFPDILNNQSFWYSKITLVILSLAFSREYNFTMYCSPIDDIGIFIFQMIFIALLARAIAVQKYRKSFPLDIGHTMSTLEVKHKHINKDKVIKP